MSDVSKKNSVIESLSPLGFYMLVYQLLPEGLYLLIFKLYELL